MNDCKNFDDYVWLTGDVAARWLTDIAAWKSPLHQQIARLRREMSATRAHLLLEQVELRRRARAKFTAAGRMFFTRIGLEQATDEWIAAYKAGRFRQRESVLDLCCGLGGDLLGLVRHAPVRGVDRDAVATLFAAQNAAAPATTAAARVTIETADAERVNLTVAEAWHLDPDRRPAGRRTSTMARSSPSLAAIERMRSRVPHAAIKLAPVAEVPEAWQHDCEREWISRDRQCRQQIIWHGQLAQRPGMRRATLVSRDVSHSYTGRGRVPLDVAHCLGRYVFEPDPAVLAADLTGALAESHGLAALASGSVYLTGPTTIDDPMLACFEVQETFAWDHRLLSRYFRERQVGELEIKCRGVRVDPAQLRRRLKLRGSDQRTLIVSRVGDRVRAIVAIRPNRAARRTNGSATTSAIRQG